MTKRLLLTAFLAFGVGCAPESSPRQPPVETGGAPAPTGGARTGGAPSPGTGGASTGGASTGGAATGGAATGGSGSGGSGGSGGAADAGPRDTSGGGTDTAASQDTSGSTGDAAPSGMGPAGALHNLVITVPCPAGTSATATSCSVATTVRAFDKPYMIQGNPATTYKVQLKFCGVYEGRPYTGCMTSPDSPRICINGMAGTGGFAPTYPTLALKVNEPAPARTIYLNAGDGSGDNRWADNILKLDFTTTIDVKGGSTVNFISDGGNNGGIYTPLQMGRRHTCPTVPGIAMQPYTGQFLHVQVVSVTPMD